MFFIRALIGLFVKIVSQVILFIMPFVYPFLSFVNSIVLCVNPVLSCMYPVQSCGNCIVYLMKNNVAGTVFAMWTKIFYLNCLIITLFPLLSRVNSVMYWMDLDSTFISPLPRSTKDLWYLIKFMKDDFSFRQNIRENFMRVQIPLIYTISSWITTLKIFISSIFWQIILSSDSKSACRHGTK